MSDVRLAVDFGTSNTTAVLAQPAGPGRPLLFDGSEMLPSAVCVGPGTGLFVGPDAGLLVGRDALHAARSNPAGFEPHPKRRVDDETVLLRHSGRPVEVPVVEVFAAVLGRVAAEARRVAGELPAPVALTCPAGWGTPRRGVLLAAARRAGLIDPFLVVEPVAAAAFFVEVVGARLPVGGYAVVYDFGAGTFDATVVRRTADGFAVLATGGLAELGGLDLDAAIVDHLRRIHGDRTQPTAWRRLGRPESTDDRRSARAFWDDVRGAKEMLTRASATQVHVPHLDVDLPLTRDEFEQLARPIVDRTVDCVAGVLRTAGVPADQLAGLFLVGGSSRVPLVDTMLRERLGVMPVAVDQPELVVALGASLTTGPAGPTGPTGPAGPTGPTGSDATPIRAVAVEPTAVDLDGRAPARRWRPSVAVFAATLTLILAASIGTAWAVLADREPPGPDAGAAGPASSLLPVIDTGYATVHAIAFGPDGRSVATAGGNDHNARIWDAVTGELGVVLSGSSVVSAVAFSPDGTLLATDSTIWTVDTASQAHSLDSSHYWVSFNRDGTLLAVAGGYSVNEGVRLFDPATGELVRSLSEEYASGVAFSPDGTRVAAAAGYKGTLVLLDVATGDPVQAYTGGGGIPAFSPDGRFVASSGEAAVGLWEVDTARPVRSFETGGGEGHPVFSPDGRLLAAAGADLVVRLWNVDTATLVSEFPGHTDDVTGLAFSPDGRYLASGGADHTVRLWSVPVA
ncbi:Hsp70 family protein [Solwaraspora sp. WMMB335]|uniref:Hsp70 family protein n=1 Tax=Solwaraspora sp. WMMB335 TaxID=3404118 RepID=UPI003B9661C5